MRLSLALTEYVVSVHSLYLYTYLPTIVMYMYTGPGVLISEKDKERFYVTYTHVFVLVFVLNVECALFVWCYHIYYRTLAVVMNRSRRLTK